MPHCVVDGCNTYSSFAPEGRKSIHCASHKKPGEVNVVSPRCRSPGCQIRPNFAPSGRTPIHCASHKRPGDINVTKKVCTFPACRKTPTFGPAGGSTRRCKPHALPDDVDIYVAPCVAPHCDTCASYAKEGCRPKHCSKHKEGGEIRARGFLCAHPGCTVSPAFAQPGSTPTHCGQHRAKGDVDVMVKACLEDGCGKRATYGPKDGKTKRCPSHRMPEDVDLINSRCHGAICSTYSQHERPFAKKHNPVTGKTDMCAHCWRAQYPELDENLSVRKEHFVLAEIQRQIPELETYFLTHDCAIPGQSCSMKRPDMVWIIEDTLVHVEIDEGGKGHEDNLERLVGIHVASGLMYHACIRFNPDEYDDYPACLRRKQSRSGEPIYSKNAEEWDRRIPILIDHMKSVLEACVNGQGSSVAGKTKLCF